jgi:hypothetical protein
MGKPLAVDNTVGPEAIELGYPERGKGFVRIINDIQLNFSICR